MVRISGGERLLAVLGYLAILFIIPVKVKRDSMFVQFHARQGGVLFVLWAILAVILTILLFVFGGNQEKWAQNTSTGLIVVLMVFTFIYALMALAGIFKALLGERYRMPVVADVALLLRL